MYSFKRRSPLPQWLLLVMWPLSLACQAVPQRPLVPQPAAPAAQAHEVALRYLVTYRREPEHALEVEVERGPHAPVDFLFTSPGGVTSLEAVDRQGHVSTLAVEEGAVSVTEETYRLRYRYPLDELIQRWGPSVHSGLGEGEARLLSGRAWLLRPRVARASLRAELRLEGVEALLPWPPGPGGVYRLTGEDLVDSGFHGFGGRRCSEVVEGGTLEIGLLGDMERVGDKGLCAWVRQAAQEVLTVRRRFPSPRVVVLVVPMPESERSGLFGMVQWSTPPSIALLAGQQAAPRSFRRDWVAVHEMLHLAHPTFLPRVPWLSEGLATYYTELARARSGRQSTLRAWQELLAGFERGREQAGDMSMEAVCAQGNLYQGTYWTGALLALHVDVELRRLSANRHCLDEVLERLAQRGPTSNVEEFGVMVDALAGEPLFQPLLQRHMRAPAFAEQQSLLQALGVRAGRGGVRLVPAPLARLRDALMAGRCTGAEE